jgi:phage tail-like protein
MKKQVLLAVVGLTFVGMTATMVNAGVTYGREKLKTTTKTQGDFNLSNHFSVEINGISVTGVHTARGYKASTDTITYKDGEDGVIRTRPGNHKPGKIVLTKDWSNTLDWFQWRKNVIDGKTDRRTVSIIFHDDAGKEVGRMNFSNCWPTKHVMPSFNEKQSGHATETIELTYETLTESSM